MKTYTYKRADGGTTDCYGKLRPDSNIQVTCENEMYDFMYTTNSCKTWEALCRHLEANHNNKVEELTAV